MKPTDVMLAEVSVDCRLVYYNYGIEKYTVHSRFEGAEKGVDFLKDVFNIYI